MGKFEWSTVRRAVLVAVVLSAGLPVCAQAAPIDLLTQANVRLDGAASFDEQRHLGVGGGRCQRRRPRRRDRRRPRRDNNGRNNSGSAYVCLGPATPERPSTSPTAARAAPGFRIDGAAATDGSGYSVSGAGDVNGDGRDDVIIGAPCADNNGRGDSGSSYVVYGAGRARPILTSAPLTAAQGFRIDGAAADDDERRVGVGGGRCQRRRPRRPHRRRRRRRQQRPRRLGVVVRGLRRRHAGRPRPRRL